MQITSKGLEEIYYIDEFSNTKIKGAFDFLTEEEQQNIVESIQKYAIALEKNRLIQEGIKIQTLSTSRVIRSQIITLIEQIQKDEFLLPITPEINASVLKAETEYCYNHTCNFWYAVNNAGEIIGSIGLKKIDSINAEIKKLFVHARYRGKGVAKKLLATLLKAATKHGFECLYLGTVQSLEAAQRFYEKNNFIKILESDLPLDFEKCPLDTIFFKNLFIKIRMQDLKP